MTDVALRRAERTDPVDALAWRLRHGEISMERVAYAAALGHRIALQVVEPAKLLEDKRNQVEQGAALLGSVKATRWVCDLAECAIAHAWIDVSDHRPAEAIAAARAWADCPCEEHARMARTARGGAEAAAISISSLLARGPKDVWEAAWAAAAAAATAIHKAAWMVETAWTVEKAIRAGAITWDDALDDLAERLMT